MCSFEKINFLCIVLVEKNMPKYISPEGIEFPSKVEYYRTLEPQGSRSISNYFSYMSRKYDLKVKEQHRNHCKEEHKKKYNSNEEYRSNKIKSSLNRYYLNKSKKNDLSSFLPIVVN